MILLFIEKADDSRLSFRPGLAAGPAEIDIPVLICFPYFRKFVLKLLISLSNKFTEVYFIKSTVSDRPNLSSSLFALSACRTKYSVICSAILA
jgi:hypothetical protein